MHKKHHINNLYNCIYLQLVYSTYICYYNYTINKAAAPTKNEPPPIKKKGSYIIARVKRNEKNKQQGSQSSG